MLRFVVYDKFKNLPANHAMIRLIASKSTRQIVACKRAFNSTCNSRMNSMIFKLHNKDVMINQIKTLFEVCKENSS